MKILLTRQAFSTNYNYLRSDLQKNLESEKTPDLGLLPSPGFHGIIGHPADNTLKKKAPISRGLHSSHS